MAEPTEPVIEETDPEPEPEPDVPTLEELVTRQDEYEAVLKHLLGDEFSAIIDDSLMVKRDGTYVFSPPKEEPPAQEPKQAETEPKATPSNINKIRAQMAARNKPAEDTGLTMKKISELSPAEFVKNQTAIFEAVANMKE